MNLSHFCRTLGFSEETECLLAPHWKTLLEHVPESLPFYLKPEFYETHYPLIHSPDPYVPERMKQVAKIADSSPETRFYAGLLHYCLFLAEPAIPVRQLPLPEKIWGENAGILHLMNAMSYLPLYEKTLHRLGIPVSYAADAASWIGGTIPIYAAAHHGIPGHTVSQSSWLRLAIDGKLFRIGRLEYLLTPWQKDYTPLYVSRKTGAVQALCQAGLNFREDGMQDPEHGTRRTSLEFSADGVTGTPVGPDGKPGPETITLSRKEWEPVCAPWEPVVTLHIPGGSPMTMESAGDSLKKALVFFRTYFQMNVRFVHCGSWLLDPGWRIYLPNSNLAKFQHLSRPLPAYPPGNLTFFVYGKENADPDREACTSSMHRAFRKRKADGSEFRAGAMYLTAEDIANFGRVLS